MIPPVTLGVNIDHVATLRQARGTRFPDPVYAAQVVFSALWLRRFRYGPLEWLWRSLTYLRPKLA